MVHVFTSGDLVPFDAFVAVVKKSAESKTDTYHRYDSERFVILGNEAYNAISEKYNIVSPYWSACSKQLKSTAKEAEVVTAYNGTYVYDASSKNGYFDRTYRTCCVKYKDLYMEASFYSLKTTSELRILNDTRDYYHKITEKWKSEHPEPNRVGTLTDKKAAEWYDYLIVRREEYDRIIREENETVSNFLERVRKAVPLCKSASVEPDRGKLCANNLVFSYRIESGHIYREIKLDWRGEHNLETFLKMIKGEC